ncbi:PD-(D/E)XK nuclease family protein [Bacillus sp. SCS-153A]|uniref:PD-(D/E)XK nuclease family protein n=1 Tax=Rossellomorea sedimentorum TaxID=3115294 RepID=UPI0039069FC8
MNTFTLLNSFYREDVISDLICNLINHESEFARWFAREICEVSTANAGFAARTRIGLGRGIGTPDLVIERRVDAETNLIIVIENKLGALEGGDQTNRYASEEGINKLRSALNAPPSTAVVFLFLTLDLFTPAANPTFKKKDYQEFIDVNWDELIRDESARKVISDYTELLKEFYDPITTSKPTDIISAKYEEINSLQRKLIWIKMLQFFQGSLPNGLSMTFGEAGGFGRNAAVFLFSKEDWERNKFDGSKLTADSVSVHFELSIDLLSINAVTDFAMHYEPNPYQPKKAYMKVDGYSDYVQLREQRIASFHHSINKLNQKKDYIKRNGSNSILKININKNDHFEDVIKELIANMEKLSPLVDEMLELKSLQ